MSISATLATKKIKTIGVVGSGLVLVGLGLASGFSDSMRVEATVKSAPFFYPWRPCLRSSITSPNFVFV